MLKYVVVCIAFCGIAVSGALVQTKPSHTFLTGVDANYALELEKKGKTWSTDGKPDDLFTLLARAGCDSFRVRLWTGDEGMNGLTYATETALRAQRAGLKPYLVIFLSENWSDMVKQPVPAIWKELDEPAKLKAITDYADRVTRHFTEAGVNIDVYEIGNEIDFGICGVFEEEWPKRVSVEYMSQRIWPRMAAIIRAAQAGVRRSKPDAKFILHLARWNEPAYDIAFWKFMSANGVAVEYPGLSFFPTSAKPGENGFDTFDQHAAAIHAGTGKRLMICEYGYPTAPTFPGQFADWNKPVAGYTLDESGQAKWLTDFLTRTRSSDHLAGAFYWSPEWNDSNLWDAFALFDAKGNARPALKSLKTMSP